MTRLFQLFQRQKILYLRKLNLTLISISEGKTINVTKEFQYSISNGRIRVSGGSLTYCEKMLELNANYFTDFLYQFRHLFE